MEADGEGVLSRDARMAMVSVSESVGTWTEIGMTGVAGWTGRRGRRGRRRWQGC